MIYFKDFNFNLIQFEYVNVRLKGKYCKNVFTFDTETTSCFVANGTSKAENFKYDTESGFYKNYDKRGYVYIWAFGIDNTVVYGRTLEEYSVFVTKLQKAIGARFIIYVHNLSFDFQFLMNYFDFEVFARKTHKVMKALDVKNNCEYKCSYFLTHKSLDTCCKDFKLEVPKLTGTYDYNILRNPLTPLTKTEMQYVKNDILALNELIKHYLKKYGSIDKIPLTQTGEVRSVAKKRLKTDRNYSSYIKRCNETNYASFSLLEKAFAGGYTHANAIYSDTIIENVTSKDISSSYPTVMIAEKYPTLRFVDIFTEDKEKYEKNYAMLLHVRFYDVKSRFFNNYISVSKCEKAKNSLIDNGRIDKADFIEIVLTDIDFEIILKCYEIAIIEYVKIKISKYEYLNREITDFSLELFEQKTTLKGIADQESNYITSKQFINSLSGMMVTSPLNPEVVLENNLWNVTVFDENQKSEMLSKYANKKSTFLSFSVGVWVTAYARRNLFLTLTQLDSDVVYCDTDSIKYINVHDRIFSKYNLKIKLKLFTACEIMCLDFEKSQPFKKNGEQVHLGVFEYDGEYQKFKTLGAKKYCYLQDNELHITVSGVQKKAVSALKTIDDFKVGLIFDEYQSGRMICYYNDEQLPSEITDSYGNSYTYSDKHGICLMPTTYELSIAQSYDDYITYAEQIEHE